MRYDLVVVGGGIAAAAALIRLQGSGLRIAVIRQEDKPDFKIGETLSPAANQEFRLLGLDVAEIERFCRPARSKFFSWGTNDLRETYQWRSGAQTGWCLDRIRFEQWLWQLAEATTFTLLEEKVVGADFSDRCWMVNTNEGTRIKASRLLDCSGRAGVVVRNHGTRERHDKLVCRYAVLEQEDKDVDPTPATLIEPVRDGWWYSVLLPDGRLLVSFFTDSDLSPARDMDWAERLSATEYTLKRIISAGFPVPTSGKVVDAATIVTKMPADEHLLAAGDAWACFDPLSSHGMTTALWSGRRVGEVLAAPAADQSHLLVKYRKDYQGGIDNYLAEQRRIYGLEGRFVGAEFWGRRAR
jgi:flavin-dependent dehydrogenase